MMFVLRMVRREIRASWQRLLFFFLCIAIGVASIVAIRSVIQNVRAGLDARDARAHRGRRGRHRESAVHARRCSPRVEQERRAGRSASWRKRRRCRPWCAGAGSIPKMVELRAVQASFPLYGTLTLQQGQYSHASFVTTVCSCARSC
jgi:putative ABC transport system permease protein